MAAATMDLVAIGENTYSLRSGGSVVKKEKDVSAENLVTI
jgi:hypothetical protein